MSEAARDNLRKKDKERKQRKREELAKEKENEERTTYKTPAALGKAQTKAMKALPSDPQRAQEVVMGMKKMLDKTVGKRDVEVESSQERQVLKGDAVLRRKIVDFYFQPDIAYTCPGKKDYVMVKHKDGSRIKATKYVLVLTVSEVFSEFLKTEPQAKVSVDTFAKLRPVNVLLRHCLPKNVCVCIYHANINYLISALHKKFHRFPAGHRELIKLTTCCAENIHNEDCQTGKCADCAPLCTVDYLLEVIGVSVALAHDEHANHLWWEKETDLENKERLRKVEKHHISLYNILLQLHELLQPFKLKFNPNGGWIKACKHHDGWDSSVVRIGWVG